MSDKRYPDDQKYCFHWLSGKKEYGYGSDPAEAMTRLGYGSGALRALDYYSTVDESTLNPSSSPASS